MKAIVSSALLVLCVLGYSCLARAAEEVRIRPVDILYIRLRGVFAPFQDRYFVERFDIKRCETRQLSYRWRKGWDVDHGFSKNLGNRCESGG